MGDGCGEVGGCPGNGMWGPAGNPRDLVALQALHQGRFAVDGGGGVALLAMVIVAPRIHLKVDNTVTATLLYLNAFLAMSSIC